MIAFLSSDCSLHLCFELHDDVPVSINPRFSSTSSKPNLHCNLLIAGRYGRRSLGITQESPSLSYSLDLKVDIGFIIRDILFKIGSIFLFVLPNGIIVFEQYLFFFFGYDDSFELKRVPDSLNKIAVASIVLGIINVPGIADENTLKIVTPKSPDDRRLTCPPITGS